MNRSESDSESEGERHSPNRSPRVRRTLHRDLEREVGDLDSVFHRSTRGALKMDTGGAGDRLRFLYLWEPNELGALRDTMRYAGHELQIVIVGPSPIFDLDQTVYTPLVYRDVHHSV
eukprot:SAG11_NODE_8520_length_1006_cov_2.165380_1_plen_117_part_00